MAEKVVPVYCDLSTGSFVEGKQSRQRTTIPFGKFYHKDKLRLAAYPIMSDPYGQTRVPNSHLPVTGISLTASVFDTAGTLLAATSSFTVDTSEEVEFLSGELDCNTSEMSTWIGSALEKDVYIEFVFSSTDIGAKGVQTLSKVYKRLSTAGASAPVGSATYPTVDQMRAECLLKEMAAGEGIILKSPDGTKRCILWLDNNGTFKADPLV